MGLHILQDLPHKMLRVNPPKEVNWVLGMYSFFVMLQWGGFSEGDHKTQPKLRCDVLKARV